MRGKLDEGFAAELLKRHLETRGEEGDVEICELDPPDLQVRCSNGEVWGVEVVRIYQQVGDTRVGSGSISSEGDFRFLYEVGRKIGQETLTQRRREYSLFLYGRGSFIHWTKQTRRQPFEEWERATRNLIRAHIDKDSPEALRGPGFDLRPGKHGTRWSVFPSSGVHETASALNGAIGKAFEDKSRKLHSWKLRCKQRWLFALNCYPLAEDDAATAELKRLLLLQAQGGFDGVFWSGFPERNPVVVQRG